MIKIAMMLGTILILTGFCNLVNAGKYNRSFNGRITWVTANDGEALEKEMEMTEQMSALEDPFHSLDSMLQWAIGNSDPEQLRRTAQEFQRLNPIELERRQAEIKELMEKLKMPSDAELMKIAIADLNNLSLSVEDHHRALHELLVLVEPIDNANDLNKLGGLTAVVGELYRIEEELRTTAAWVLGKASQNNPVVQKQILELGVLPKLMRMVKSICSEEAVKALYAVSAVIRNNLDGQAVFNIEGGALMLQDIMSNSSSDIRLHKKSLFLVADLIDQAMETISPSPPFQADKELLKSVVDLLSVPDLDMQEKALVTIRSLLQIHSTNAQVFKDFCHFESALKRLGRELEELMLDDKWGDFARDVEALRQEVVSIFYTKLE